MGKYWKPRPSPQKKNQKPKKGKSEETSFWKTNTWKKIREKEKKRKKAYPRKNRYESPNGVGTNLEEEE